MTRPCGRTYMCAAMQDMEQIPFSSPKTIGTLNKIFYIYGSNLVILAWTGLELSRGQASDWHTEGQTDAGNNNTRWPYWPWLTKQAYFKSSYDISMHIRFASKCSINNTTHCSIIICFNLQPLKTVSLTLHKAKRADTWYPSHDKWQLSSFSTYRWLRSAPTKESIPYAIRKSRDYIYGIYQHNIHIKRRSENESLLGSLRS